MNKDIIPEIHKIEGKSPVILVIPHGHENDYPGLIKIAQLIHDKTNCSLLFNNKWKKSAQLSLTQSRSGKRGIKKKSNINRIDLERIDQVIAADLIDSWVAPLVSLANTQLHDHGASMIIVLKAIPDKHMAKVSDQHNMIVGAGHTTQKSGKEDRQTVDLKAINSFIDQLQSPFLSPLFVRGGDGHQPAKHAAWEKNCLSQVFSRYSFINDLKPSSLQLTIAESLLDDQGIEEIANTISHYLLPAKLPQHQEQPEILEQDIDDSLVNMSVTKITEIFVSHIHDALSEVGSHLLETFFEGNIELARQKKPLKDLSYTKLIHELEATSGNGPKKSWLFNSLNIAVQNADMKECAEYSGLTGSHKILLLTVKDIAIKKDLAVKVAKSNYSVRKLKEMLSTSPSATLPAMASQPAKLFSAKPTEQLLQEYKKLTAKEQARFRENIEKQQKKINNQIKQQQEYLSDYASLLGKISNI